MSEETPRDIEILDDTPIEEFEGFSILKAEWYFPELAERAPGYVVSYKDGVQQMLCNNVAAAYTFVQQAVEAIQYYDAWKAETQGKLRQKRLNAVD